MSTKSLGLPLLVTALTGLAVLMICFPSAYLESALRGLAIWWDVLFPSLFPFFIISEMMLGFGVVHLFGTLLDPLMKPLFRIPGSGGFVAAMGYVSGYPIGAKLTAKLWEQKMVNREEGERLVAFTTSSDPIFLIGAVSVGFFHNPKIAVILALAHYGGGFIIGLLMRFHGKKSATPSRSPIMSRPSSLKKRTSRLQEAFKAMHQARMEDGRSLGELLRESVESSLKLIIVVGGLVVFFSVFLELLTKAGIMTSLYHLLEAFLSVIGMPPSLSEALVGGLFEVTLGARFAGEAATSVPLPFKAAAAAFILSWGGLSVHAQIASILHFTNLRYFPFMVARLIHGVIAAILVLLCWNAVMGNEYGLEAAFSSLAYDHHWTNISTGFVKSLSTFVLLLFFMTAVSIFAVLIRKFWGYLRQHPGK